MCKQRKRERQTVFGSYNYGTGQITISFADKGNNPLLLADFVNFLFTPQPLNLTILAV